ncbi:hypothetical protein PVMG_02728 [Plasmodium vivax Mauritania I]|uniref:Uncharacterized protein n=1 Tax=Plasmodium vivax Mauritania I TaxID=1035515 RepID=A0A0J9TI11_PLAVI|nr:hypothetical protein PVMG_02728 [Plasmodium vivax Mauritania I]
MCTKSRAEAREPFWRDIARIDRLIYAHEKKLQSCNCKKRKCYRLLSLWADYDKWLSETCERYAWKVRALRMVGTGSRGSATCADEEWSSRIGDCPPSGTPCAASKDCGHLAKWSSVHATAGERLRKRRKKRRPRGGKIAGGKLTSKTKGQGKPQLNCANRRGDPPRGGNEKVQEDAEGGEIKGGHSLGGVERPQGEENGDEAAEEDHGEAAEEVHENEGQLPGVANPTCEDTGGREADGSEGTQPNGRSRVAEREGSPEAVEEWKVSSCDEKEKEEETGRGQTVHNSVGEKSENSLETVPSGSGGCPHKIGGEAEEEKEEEEEKKEKTDKQHKELEFSEVQVRAVTLEEGDAQTGGKQAAKEKRARGGEKKAKGKKRGGKKEKRARKGEGKKAKGKEKMMEEGEEGEKATETAVEEGKETAVEEATEEKMEEVREVKVEEGKEEKMEGIKEAAVKEEKEEKMGGEKEQMEKEVEEVKMEKAMEVKVEEATEEEMEEEKEEKLEGEKEQRAEEATEEKVEEETEGKTKDERNEKLGVEKEAMVQKGGDMYTEGGGSTTMEGEKQVTVEGEQQVTVEGEQQVTVEGEQQMKVEGEKPTNVESEKPTTMEEDSSIGEGTEEKIEDEGEAKADVEREQNSGGEKEAKPGAAQRSDHEDEPGKTAGNEIVHHILSEYSNTIQYTSFLDYIKNKETE